MFNMCIDSYVHRVAWPDQQRRRPTVASLRTFGRELSEGLESVRECPDIVSKEVNTYWKSFRPDDFCS